MIFILELIGAFGIGAIIGVFFGVMLYGLAEDKFYD